MLSCMCHILKFLHDLVVDLCDVSQLGFNHSEVHQSGFIVHLCKETANAVHLSLRVPVHLHYGVATLKVLGVLDNAVCIPRFHVFSSMPGGLPIRVPSFPSLVRDAIGESAPSKGSKDDPAVLNVYSVLMI